ncbi:MAG: pantoate--beta-alanine ligase [Gammaproteobacteria bacterium RIFCSPHIGHO2_12_FULL_45_12]|nr:MAG: pantoate--beta-alanine ligase [Gammaproteobacteria bacterium RIFCSPHIGHO2_12_FULL_45_12]
MNIVTEVSAWRTIRKTLSHKSIGFVPTMGHVHEGHLSLCRRSHVENDVTVVSVFVNPTQFNQASDFDAYPRTVETDQAALREARVDYLILPEVKDMYPDAYQVQVVETALSESLEGKCRPGHFNGMLTVVMKLLNLVQPARAYFGKKDYQQYLLVRKVAQALLMDVTIVGCETVRADDGLALSSRNARLTPKARERASQWARLLKSGQSPAWITTQLIDLGFEVEYIADQWGRRLGAVWLDDVRLIDNVPLEMVSRGEQ